jgi:anthranilate synthase component 2
MILVIDNYDSFTYNLVHYLNELGAVTRVVRNDVMTAAEAISLKPEAILMSPGPCTPDQAGICLELIKTAPDDLPLLGVCLGHQAIGAALGGRIVRAQRQMHGKASTLSTDGEGVYKGLPREFSVIRYHSLAIERETCPAELQVTSRSEDGEIMGVRHRELAGTRTPLEGVQFHPESILTQHGHALLKNFLER